MRVRSRRSPSSIPGIRRRLCWRVFRDLSPRGRVAYRGPKNCSRASGRFVPLCLSEMITGDQFIEYAARLAAKAVATEAEQRSASSRGYYGAYHLARAFLKEVGLPRADHQQVKICLLAS